MTPVNFNPRPREGSDHPGRGAALDAAGFQSTPPRGERLGGRFLGATLAYYFNPRPREGSDGSKLTKVLHPSDFNPRPREGSDFYPEYMLWHWLNFNPRPREGSDPSSYA